MRTRYDWLFWSVVAPFVPIVFIVIAKVVQGDIIGLVDFLNTANIPMYAFFVAMAAQSYVSKEMGFTSTVWEQLEDNLDSIDENDRKSFQLYASIQKFWLPGLTGIAIVFASLLLSQEADFALVNISPTTIAFINTALMVLSVSVGLWLSPQVEESRILIKRVLGQEDESNRPDIDISNATLRLGDGDNNDPNIPKTGSGSEANSGESADSL